MSQVAENRLDGADPSHAGSRWLDALIVFLLVLLSAWIRLDTAAMDGALERGPEAGLLKSDPGLLYYLTSQVANAEDWLPEDWNADPRIAYPQKVDIPADYTVGQEFLLGWSWKHFGGDISLLRWCHYGAALMAALAVLGVWGLAFELCGGRWPALLASLLYLGTPASFRTIGFVLIREDLSLTFFALHLWLFARALRVGSRASAVWATLLAVLALATWHAMSFVCALEVLALFVVFLVKGRTPLRTQGPLVLGILALGYVLIPSLGSGAFLGAMGLLSSLWLGPRLRPRQPRLSAVALAVASLGIGALVLGSGGSNFGHVYEVLLAKVLHGGVLPADPNELSFDARLLWQGPFATLDLALAPGLLGVALFVGLPACLYSLFSNSRSAPALGLFALLSLPVTWLIVRMSCLPAILLPPLAVFLFVRLQQSAQSRVPQSSSAEGTRSLAELACRLIPIIAGLLLFGQLSYSSQAKSRHRLAWYRPQSGVQELAQLVNAVEIHVPPGQPVATDFMSSTAILAQTGRPMILQPKWERNSARRRVEAFWNAFYRGSTQGLRDHLRADYGCSYLVVDRSMLWVMHASRYSAGFPRSQEQPLAETAASDLLGENSDSIPGYQLLWKSEHPSDPARPARFQLFALDENQ